MSELKLTDAESIEVESFYDGAAYQTREDKLEVDRWTEYGHDRLYINAGISKCDKYSLYIDLETHEIVSDNDGKHKGGSVEIDGDTAEITIIESGVSDKEHVITVSLDGEGFEAEDDEDDDDEPEIVTDGGQDVTEHIEDSTIEEATTREVGSLDHPDTPTVQDVRDALAWIQEGIAGEFWADWCSNLEHNECEVVYEDSDVIIFATGEHDVPRRDLRDNYDDDLHERMPDIVSAVHHRVARDRTNYDWGYEYPLVIRKPEGFEAGQRYVEALINSLQKRGLTPGQAWAYYGVEIRGESRNSWGKRKGDSDHKNVSDALDKAKDKLP